MSVVFVRNPCLGWIEIFKNYLQNLSPVLSEIIKREMPSYLCKSCESQLEAAVDLEEKLSKLHESSS